MAEFPPAATASSCDPAKLLRGQEQRPWEAPSLIAYDTKWTHSRYCPCYKHCTLYCQRRPSFPSIPHQYLLLWPLGDVAQPTYVRVIRRTSTSSSISNSNTRLGEHTQIPHHVSRTVEHIRRCRSESYRREPHERELGIYSCMLCAPSFVSFVGAWCGLHSAHHSSGPSSATMPLQIY